MNTNILSYFLNKVTMNGLKDITKFSIYFVILYFINTNSIFQIVVKEYAQSFRDLLPYEKSNPNDAKTLENFAECIIKIRERHTNTVITMAEAVMEMKQKQKVTNNSGKNGHNKQPRYMENIQYFLDRLYTSRISTRMLINQHTALFTDLENVSTIFKNSKMIFC